MTSGHQRTRNALANLKALESFESSFSQSALFCIWKEATVKLQDESQDIVYGVTTIQRCCTELKALRADTAWEDYSHRIF
jgi:hypothetical protein